MGKSQEKILKIFAGAVPRLGDMVDKGDLSGDKLRECIYSLNKLREIDVEIRKGKGWSTVYLLYFLDRDSPAYRGQMLALSALRLKTLGHFLTLSLDKVRSTFTEHGTELPAIFEVFHTEFRRKEQVA